MEKMENLSDRELVNVTAGGWLYDLGAAAHEAWDSVLDGLHAYGEAMASMGSTGGGYAGMGYTYYP